MSTPRHWTKSTVIFAGAAAWGLLFVSCTVADRTVVAPAKIAGATYVGSKKCSECHDDQSGHFASSTHARLALKDDKGVDIGCESCHGPGSLHVKVGGSKATIVNPGKSPEACFQCHLDKRGQFSLPHSHPVLAGKMSCVDCHDVHSGNAVRGSGADLEAQNETCVKCHSQQKGPFVFEHGAMREGCVSCHNPHGTVNQKMLVARDANLCLRCHLEAPDPGSSGQINANAIRHTSENHNSRLMQGTCWSAGCHEAPHGSNANNHFRY
ncbi:MAG TPA: cytochrome c3 family protein [Lacunisphaera sp.]|nr:cytochrome c3 family protein [Lacunisphaera sp.]